MKSITRILCVIDPTAETQPALGRAAWLARRTGAALELVICWYNEYLASNPFYEPAVLQNLRDSLTRENEERLENLASPLREDLSAVTTRVLWDHPLHDGIVRHAARIGADVVFKDTHHHSALARGLFSNTDWNLIRNCAALLWLVKPSVLPPNPLILAAIDPLNANDKPASLDDRILGVATSLGEVTDGPVHAFHAYDPRLALISVADNAYVPVPLLSEEIEQDMRARHETRFRELTDFHDIEADNAHLVSGATNVELPVLADELHATVVVMGAVSRSRLKRLFVGATAERTLEHLPCDVLIVKPDWYPAMPVEQEGTAA
jgi:universal stress protein E